MTGSELAEAQDKLEEILQDYPELLERADNLGKMSENLKMLRGEFFQIGEHGVLPYVDKLIVEAERIEAPNAQVSSSEGCGCDNDEECEGKKGCAEVDKADKAETLGESGYRPL